jgi:hypothetical protein
VIPPNAIGPGVPTHPIVLPPNVPSHPIVIPPEAIIPDQSGKAHIVVYHEGKRMTFTVDTTTLPPRPPPTEATPKR